jgi:hypothetical protein
VYKEGGDEKQQPEKETATTNQMPTKFYIYTFSVGRRDKACVRCNDNQKKKKKKERMRNAKVGTKKVEEEG